MNRLNQIECYLERVQLEQPDKQHRTWECPASVNYFSAQGDKRWWQDHRFPAGLAFSVNSVGHMVKSGKLNEAMRSRSRKGPSCFSSVQATQSQETWEGQESQCGRGLWRAWPQPRFAVQFRLRSACQEWPYAAPVSRHKCQRSFLDKSPTIRTHGSKFGITGFKNILCYFDLF